MYSHTRVSIHYLPPATRTYYRLRVYNNPYSTGTLSPSRWINQSTGYEIWWQSLEKTEVQNDDEFLWQKTRCKQMWSSNSRVVLKHHLGEVEFECNFCQFFGMFPGAWPQRLVWKISSILPPHSCNSSQQGGSMADGRVEYSCWAMKICGDSKFVVSKHLIFRSKTWKHELKMKKCLVGIGNRHEASVYKYIDIDVYCTHFIYWGRERGKKESMHLSLAFFTFFSSFTSHRHGESWKRGQSRELIFVG